MRTRPGAYGWIVRDGQILLTYWSGKDLSTGEALGAWTLPGGGMEFGEQCEDTIRREVTEETGYEVTVGRLIGVSNLYLPEAEVRDYDEDLHSIQVVHVAAIVGGNAKSLVCAEHAACECSELDAQSIDRTRRHAGVTRGSGDSP